MSKRCQAKTQKGTQCKNSAEESSEYCHIHSDLADEKEKNQKEASQSSSEKKEASPSETIAVNQGKSDSQEEVTLPLSGEQRVRKRDLTGETVIKGGMIIHIPSCLMGFISGVIAGLIGATLLLLWILPG